MRVLLVVICTALLSAPAASSAKTDETSSFGRLFPDLPGFVDPTPQQIADLAQTMRDPNLASGEIPGVGSIVTYFGQGVVDHDITLDASPPPTGPVDPTTLTNSETFRIDMSEVYGGGPQDSPELYEPDGVHLRVQEDNGNGVRDVPRRSDGSAVIADARNDENEIVSQLHVALLKFHNALVDRGMSFEQARLEAIHHVQWVVLHEYLPTVIGQEATDAALARVEAGQSVYDPGNPHRPMTPVEFSVAAFRFGHSEVRRAYELNETTGKIQVFSLTAPDLRGGRPLPAGRQIEWGNFDTELTDPGDVDGINLVRRIDTLISSSLFALPIPGAEATGSNVLAFRNMTRGVFYGLPSYEDVARRLGVEPVELHLGPGFEGGTPLWYGILAESEQRTGGLVLGPVGARIVGDVVMGVLRADKDSILRGHFEPDPELDANEDGRFTLADLLVDAGVAEFPDE